MALNPVEQRLVELQGLWQDFLADAGRRLLLWQVPDNARRVVHGFFEAQRHDATDAAAYVGTDTFIVFDAPFENSIRYAGALKAALAGEYQASRDALAAQGIAPDWPFRANQMPDSASGWVRGLNALAEHHPELGHLVAVLLPATVTDEPARQAWLQRALQAGPGPRVRLVVVDSPDAPALAGLAADARVHVQAIPMDAWDLARDTFAQEPAPGAAGVFRGLLAGLFGLVDKGSADQVMAKANDALAFARRQGWSDQEVVVRMLAAGAMLKAQRFDAAVGHYRHARAAAEQVAAGDHPAGRQLVLQTWFGEAGAQLAAGRLTEAGQCYAQAEPVAQDLGHPVLWIETLRMRAHCHARCGEPDNALACGQRGLQVGARMKPASRPMTTLPLLALDLLLLAGTEPAARMQAVRHRLEQDLARLQRDTEQRAAALEDQGPALQALDQQQAGRAQDLVREAVREVEALAAPATGRADDGRFAAVYAHARAVLGPGWPLGRVIDLEADAGLDEAGAPAP